MKPLEEDGPVPKRRRIQMNSESVMISMEDLNLPNLPNEIWIKILEYLSTKDILRNMAPVSRRFHQISQDPFLIKKIELKSNQEFDFSDFFKVLKRSEKLTCLSLDLNFIGQVYQIENIFEKLPFLVKHPQHLEEFCLLNSSCDLKEFKGNVLKYLVKQCPKLKIFKIDCFTSDTMYSISKTISKFKFESVKEFHLTLRGDRVRVPNYSGLVRNLLKTFVKNITPSLPNIRHLRLSIPFPPFWECRRDQRWIRRELKEFGQQIGVKIEIWNLQDISNRYLGNLILFLLEFYRIKESKLNMQKYSPFSKKKIFF